MSMTIEDRAQVEVGLGEVMVPNEKKKTRINGR